MTTKSLKTNITESSKLLKRAQKLIPSCSQTFSKSPSQFVQGVAPNFIERGKGSHVWDVDGQEFIDYGMALGAVVLGYGYESVTQAVTRQAEKGSVYTLPHPLEVELAEVLHEIIPSAEMVRFGKNGSDVTSGAVRVARAFTGREKIACAGYHGWQDWYIGTTTRNAGVPKAVQKLTLTFQYNNIESLKKVFKENPGEIAAVILEPFSLEEPKNNFLQEVQQITKENGAILIFDEVVTGFRLALAGAQEHYGVVPDLSCFGKAMGNGFSVAAVMGKRKIMELFDEIFFSFTFGGEVVSIAAALATIKEMREKKVIASIWKKGERLKNCFNELSAKHGLSQNVTCVGLPPRTVIMFKDEKGQDDLLRKSYFQQEMIKRGVLFNGLQNMSFSHTDADIDQTLAAYDEVMALLKGLSEADVKAKLEGSQVQAVFRKV